MQAVINSVLRLQTFVVALAAVLLVASFWQLRNVPLDVVPEFSPVHLVVKTEALGLSAAEVESLITVPIEADLLNGVPWLENIESESTTGLSSIEMTFEAGTNYMRARQMVQERLTQAHALPNVSSPPIMLQPISSTSHMMNVGLSSKTVSLVDMSVLARWNIAPRLLGVPGVANVAIWGQRDRQLQVLVDPERLASKGVTLHQVVKTAGEAVWASPLTYLNSSTPGTGGFVETPNQRLNVRHLAPITTAADFRKVPVHGTNIALGHTATVVEGHQPLIGDALLPDGDGLLLIIDKFPGFNTQDVTRRVEDAMAELAPGMAGIKIETHLYRPAGFLERATKRLTTALIISGILLIAGLATLLGNWRSAVVAAVATAASLIATVAVVTLLGLSLNMMLIAGLMVAIGAIVHEAVIDTATIQQRLEEAGSGSDQRSTAQIVASAMTETRNPMTYAALVLIVAVAPILFMHGLSAAFFGPLVWSYIAAVAVALLVSIIVTPALSLLLLPRAVGGAAAGGSDTAGQPRFLMAPLYSLYSGLFGSSVRSPGLTYGSAGVAVIAGFFLWATLDREMLPNFHETDVLVELESDAGTSLAAMKDMTAAAAKKVKGIPGVRTVAAQIGRAVLCNCDDTANVNTAVMWISTDPDADYKATLGAIEKAVQSQTGLTATLETYLTKQMREALTGTDENLTVRVYGHKLDILKAKAKEVADVLAKIEGVEKPMIEQTAAEETIEVEVDLERAGVHGLKPGDIRRATSALVSGITVGALFHDQKVFDVVVWGVPSARSDLAAVQNLKLDTDARTQVRLADVANVKIGQTNSVIRRQGVSRRIDIEAEVSGRSLGDVTREAVRQVAAVKFPFEYHAQVRGEQLERRTALRSIYAEMGAAAIVVFLLFQAATGSWRISFLSVLTIPVALLGGFIAVAIGGGVFKLGSLLGFVTILGLTARASLMLIKRFQSLERSGAEPFGEALIRRGVREQFGSVVASAITIALASLPFVVMGDVSGLEIAHPMSLAILGGMVTSVFASLVMIPALYLRFGGGSAANIINLDEAPA